MSKAAYGRYKKVQKECETDAEYLELETQLGQQEARFRSVMNSLTKDQCTVISSYIGICSEMAERSLEIACFME